MHQSYNYYKDVIHVHLASRNRHFVSLGFLGLMIMFWLDVIACLQKWLVNLTLQGWQPYFTLGVTVLVFFLILVIKQLDAQNLLYNKFISCLYMFRAPCAHHQEVKIVLYSLWYHHTETSEWSKITNFSMMISEAV